MIILISSNDHLMIILISSNDHLDLGNAVNTAGMPRHPDAYHDTDIMVSNSGQEGKSTRTNGGRPPIKQTNKQTNNKENKQTNKQTNNKQKKTNKQQTKQTYKQTNILNMMIM